MHMCAIAVVALLVACAGNAFAEDLTRKLDPFFDALERNGRMHGSVAVVRDGEVVYRRAMGMRVQSGADAIAANTSTMYRGGSLTKLFTAAMVYQLVDEGKLSLATRLSEFFPSIPNAGEITIAHMLAHTSGIGNLPTGGEEPQTKAALLARFAKLAPEYAPGERSTYSNTAFVLLGFIIEEVTKSSYQAQLDRRINRKLGLTRTRFGGRIDVTRNEAQSFTYDEGKWSVSPEEHTSAAAGAGAIVSTATELATFMSALFQHRLTSAKSVQEMLTPFSATLRGSEKGVVVFQMTDRNRTVYQHLGGIDAFRASLSYLPDQNASFAILFNGQNYPMGKVFHAIVDALAGRDVAVPSFTPVELPDATLASYEGVYAFPEINMDITVRASGKHLVAQATEQDPFTLDAINETTFSHPPSGILIEFRKRPEETDYSQFVLFQGASELRFRRK